MMVGDWRFGTDFSHAEDDRLEGVLVLFFEVCRFTFLRQIVAISSDLAKTTGRAHCFRSIRIT